MTTRTRVTGGTFHVHVLQFLFAKTQADDAGSPREGKGKESCLNSMALVTGQWQMHDKVTRWWRFGMARLVRRGEVRSVGLWDFGLWVVHLHHELFWLWAWLAWAFFFFCVCIHFPASFGWYWDNGNWMMFYTHTYVVHDANLLVFLVYEWVVVS
ncbi:hypothetical protein B0T19DRAFT_173213 [Cercophora scortea]|uniref:Uncharacterized protein n=1 Tax=Cercophora scortea TaxID=314031 RepID=A0AAE0IMB7_9PEZI|nr:hypothetical protein B0T19DRAFT_173213 [Cercophora scortea]